MRETRTSGSVRGASGDGRPYRERTAAARRQAETLLERPVFGIERPLSNAWSIRGFVRPGCTDRASPGTRRGGARFGSLRIGQQRLGGLDVVVGEFRRESSRAIRPRPAWVPSRAASTASRLL